MHEIDFNVAYPFYIFADFSYLLFFNEELRPLSFNLYRSMETPNERSEFCMYLRPCLIAFTRDSGSLENERGMKTNECVSWSRMISPMKSPRYLQYIISSKFRLLSRIILWNNNPN